VALVELSVVKQRYHAVMEVLAGMSVTEVTSAMRCTPTLKSRNSWARMTGDRQAG
jgi:hypothetical protein